MIIAAELISAIWGKMKMYRLIVLITLIIIRIIFYIIDARREKQGLPSKHREYMGSLTGGMDFIEHYRSDIEQEKYAIEAQEAEKRSKYRYHDDGSGMIDIPEIDNLPDDSDDKTDVKRTL